MVIGVTYRDQPDAWDLEDIQLALGDPDPQCPYLTLDARKPSSVAEVLLALVEQMMGSAQAVTSA